MKERKLNEIRNQRIREKEYLVIILNNFLHAHKRESVFFVIFIVGMYSNNFITNCELPKIFDDAISHGQQV